MKKQRFVLPVLFAFALCTVALPASDKDKGRGPGHDKSEAKHAKGHEKSERKHEKFHGESDKKHGKENETIHRGEMRFRGLDRNHDGIITRDEWRGEDRSFTNHDWNRDGVLSGDEVRPGARRPDHQQLSSDRGRGRFADLDHNNDGVITRNEWHSDRRAFDRMDANRDGALSRDELFARVDDRQARFLDLDHNRNGMIARDEWRGDRQLFERLDTNRDGMLSRDEFFRRP